MGDEFDMDIKSTEGVAIHHLKSFFNRENDSSSSWQETGRDSEDLIKLFSHSVMVMVKDKSTNQLVSGSSATTPVQLQGGKSELSQLKEASMETTLPSVPIMNEHTKSQILKYQHDEPRYSSDKRVPFSLTLWDLGGQDDFMATHHLLLHADVTTLIVMDLTQGLHTPLQQESKIGSPNTPAEVLCYWLNSFYIQARQQDVKPDIGLVLTHKDLISSGDYNDYIKSYIDDIHRTLQGKPYAEFIRHDKIYIVDNKNGNADDFQGLRNQLLQNLTSQESWNKEMPTKWLKLEADMMELAERKKVKYLDMTTLQGMASNYGLNDTEIESFLQIHNSLGHFLYFNDPKLKHIIITDPQWLVDMCKGVITNSIFLEERGISTEALDQLKRGFVTLASLAELWPGEDTDFLTSLMLKFNLFLPLKEETTLGEMYLIPCMLPPYNTNDTEPYKDMVCLYAAPQKALLGDMLLVATFHKLLSSLTINTQWALCRKDTISYSEASFDIGKLQMRKEDPLQVRLILRKGSEIETSIWCKKAQMTKDLTSTIISIKEVLSHRMALMNIGQPKDVLVLCPHFRPTHSSLCMVKGEEMKDFRVKLCENECRLHRKALPTDNYLWLFSMYLNCIIFVSFTFSVTE